MTLSEQARLNRRHWDDLADWYQREHGPQLNLDELAGYVPLEWAGKWPGEEIWKARRR